MFDIVSFALGLFVGGVIVGVLFHRAKARTQEALEQSKEELLRQTTALETLRQSAVDDEKHEQAFKEAFESLASRALRDNSTQFLELAKTKFEASEKQATAELDKKEDALKAMLKPLSEHLEKLGSAAAQMEGKREKAYGELQQYLDQLMNATSSLNTNSIALATALKGSSQARGRWGEMALRNIVEMAGMTVHCDFVEQSQDNQGNRPDMIVKLPGKGIIPVDAKVPFADFEKYLSQSDPSSREESLKAHTLALKTQIRSLMHKDYGANLDGEIDFTVMFIPSEAMLSAAFEQDPNLLSEALKNRVLIASPVTLVALLRTVSIYWKQEQMAENADRIWEAANVLYDRLIKFQEHLAKAGKGMESAVKAYNQAVGTFTSRVLPAGRRMEELGSGSEQKKELSEIDPVETAPRELIDRAHEGRG